MLLCFVFRRPAAGRPSRRGPAEHQQVVRDHPQAYTSLHPRRPPIAAAPESVTALERAYPPLASRPPPEPTTEPTLLCLFLGVFRCTGEDNLLDAQVSRGQFILP